MMASTVVRDISSLSSHPVTSLLPPHESGIHYLGLRALLSSSLIVDGSSEATTSSQLDDNKKRSSTDPETVVVESSRLQFSAKKKDVGRSKTYPNLPSLLSDQMPLIVSIEPPRHQARGRTINVEHTVIR